MGANPNLDRCAVALHWRLASPYGRVVRGENVSRRTVSRWVRLPCSPRHAISPSNAPAERKHTGQLVLFDPDRFFSANGAGHGAATTSAPNLRMLPARE